MNVEMSGLRQEQSQADRRFRDLERRLVLINGEISEVEGRVRTALDPGTSLVLEEYRMLLAYLDHQQRMRVNNERQKGFTSERLEKIENEMTRQGLKIRGMDNLLERRLKELQLEMENKRLSSLDEAWLQRQEDGL